MSPWTVTQRVSVNASRLAVPPKRVPVPESKMPPAASLAPCSVDPVTSACTLSRCRSSMIGPSATWPDAGSPTGRCDAFSAIAAT
jgi:hypothetical protein